jgi:hypothetical protein
MTFLLCKFHSYSERSETPIDVAPVEVKENASPVTKLPASPIIVAPMAPQEDSSLDEVIEHENVVQVESMGSKKMNGSVPSHVLETSIDLGEGRADWLLLDMTGSTVSSTTGSSCVTPTLLGCIGSLSFLVIYSSKSLIWSSKLVFITSSSVSYDSSYSVVTLVTVSSRIVCSQLLRKQWNQSCLTVTSLLCLLPKKMMFHK